jgi:hypothetical protein
MHVDQRILERNLGISSLTINPRTNSIHRAALSDYIRTALTAAGGKARRLAARGETLFLSRGNRREPRGQV